MNQIFIICPFIYLLCMVVFGKHDCLMRILICHWFLYAFWWKCWFVHWFVQGCWWTCWYFICFYTLFDHQNYMVTSAGLWVVILDENCDRGNSFVGLLMEMLISPVDVSLVLWVFWPPKFWEYFSRACTGQYSNRKNPTAEAVWGINK